MKKGLNYKEYIKMATEEQMEMIDRHEKKEKISKVGLDKIIEITDKREVLVFSELRCEDAATTIPILNELCKLNDNINISFYYKSENEDMLQELVGEGKIPTIVTLDKNKRVIGSYLEFPNKVLEQLKDKDELQRKLIVSELREGKFNDEIQKDLINSII